MKIPSMLTQPRTQWLGFLLGWLAISLATLTPLEQLPTVPGTDKLHHIIGFGGWAGLCLFGATRRFVLMCVAIVIWGGVIELIQPQVNRYGEWLDFYANSFGVLLAFVTHFILKRSLIRGTDTA